MSTPVTARELHSRANDGISVQLLWCEHDDRLWVSVTDSKQGDRFSIDVRDRSTALDARDVGVGVTARELRDCTDTTKPG
jgi:hypothetical protein